MHATIIHFVQIRERVALVTGASEGIGAACVEALRRRGARVALVARSASKLEQTARPGDLVIPSDITLEADRARAVSETLAAFGRIDILINNAGIGLYAPAHSAPLDEFRRMFDLNLFAALGLIQLAVPHMRARRSGSIVNVGSIAGKVTLPWFTLYSASKYALGSLTDGLRMELAPDNIHCMTVCPGYVKTRFQDHVLGGRPPEQIRRAKQFAITPEQCAEAILDGIERRARTVVTPKAGWLFVLAARLFPATVDARLAAIYHKLEHQL
ncbi:MAG: SDR family NAD(P)-dependent oxidoreductase [Bryobacteraceae bacterium]|nr:SDR family NAD(P)-dependent oxidoreductase [Bryobacteraceae bacterium]